MLQQSLGDPTIEDGNASTKLFLYCTSVVEDLIARSCARHQTPLASVHVYAETATFTWSLTGDNGDPLEWIIRRHWTSRAASLLKLYCLEHVGSAYQLTAGLVYEALEDHLE